MNVDTTNFNLKSIATLSWSPSEALAQKLKSDGFVFTELEDCAEVATTESELLVYQFAEHSIEALLDNLSQNTLRPSLIVIADTTINDATITKLLEVPCELVNSTSQEAQLGLSLRKTIATRLKRQPGLKLEGETAFEHIIAASPAMQDIFTTIEKVAQFSTTVLIQGESGTGKELIARAIHARSARKNKPFVALNCGAIPENLLESELFGHRKGSFTDATKDKPGLFEEADGGTILLDEVGELATHLQVKLLRVLQEKCIHPIGAAEPIPVDLRILAATLRDLEADVEEGRFRDDLYYRLNVVPIVVPALRQRPEDVAVLIQHFLVAHRSKLGLQVFAVSEEVQQALCSYPWPGNVRELENTLERAMILCSGETIELENLPKRIAENTNPSDSQDLLIDTKIETLSIKTHTKKLETFLIRKALEETKGNRTHAAKLLDISHRTLLYKLKEYDL